jgi:tellurite resistance protein
MTSVQADVLTKAQVLALVDGMLSTARIDGVHPQEVTLIRKFYEEQRKPDMPAFDAVEAATGKDPALLSQLGADAGFAEQLVLMCLMTGYADGKLSDGEHKHVLALAQQVGVAPPRVGELLLQVKDSLIASLAHLPEPESVAALAKTL